MKYFFSHTQRSSPTPHHYPFGSIVESRSWKGDYRYGFNGQEGDDEVSGSGISYTAEFWQYDSRLGRRWNVDPIVKFNQSLYSTFSNNPIVFIDPDGNTDYYNSNGLWIGTDGVNNGANTIITNSKIQRKISQKARKGNSYKAELPNGSFNELPSIEVVRAAVRVFDEQKLPFGKDTKGGLHEVATYFDQNGKQSDYLHGVDVLSEEDARKGYAHVEGPPIPEGFEYGKVSIHSHPTEVVEYYDILSNKKSVIGPDASEPSEGIDTKTFKNYDLNIIVGKTGEAKFENRYERIGDILSETQFVPERAKQAHFFNSKSEHLYSAGIEALRRIESGTGKSESRTHSKYEKRN